MARRERVICAAAALEDGGAGVRFPVAPGGPENGFVVRHRGVVHAYVNQCPHLGTELDWQPGEFFDFARIYLVCSTHGALFLPDDGHCIAGPCRGATLRKLDVREQDGQVLLMQEET
jgi:nitrite reductase/ring-hydroxylating ferredoxin subunit